jgi:hypothetical protein
MMRNSKKLLSMLAVTGFLGAGCLGSSPSQTSNPTSPSNPTGDPSSGGTPTPVANNPNDPTNPNNTSSGDPNNTFDHQDTNSVDPFQVLARIQEEGPPEFSTRMHSCSKMKYATLGNVLNSIAPGLVTGGKPALTDFTPNGLYVNGAGALGRPDYTNRIPESTALSTAGAVRLYDILVAAAPAMIQNMPTNTRCGTGTTMFDTSGATCTMAGISCITGAPATQAQKDLCDSAVASNTTDKVSAKVGANTVTATVGQVIAVATLAAAAHSCE